MPVIGLHSVMLSPASVRRVTPPTTMTANTNVEENRSQAPTVLLARTGSGAGGGSAESAVALACSVFADEWSLAWFMHRRIREPGRYDFVTFALVKMPAGRAAEKGEFERGSTDEMKDLSGSREGIERDVA